MADLKAQVLQSASNLRSAWTGLQATTGSSLPPKCYEQWIKRAALHQTLEGTAGIFPARDVAWAAVQSVSLPTSVRDYQRNIVAHGALDVDFAVGRHLALTTYVAVTWSAYDRLANVCGRLAGVADLAENPRQNPKACEDFLGKKDTMGFSGHLHLQQAYSWPLKVTYKIRNWLVHGGYEEGGTPLFAGDRIADGFRLHEDAANHLETCCGYKIDNGKIDFCCLTAAEECWPTRELLTILDSYHAEVDTMYAALVKWTTDAFVGQIRAFTARDRS
jgi:hypothetical protein